jgi:hypothetical protein
MLIYWFYGRKHSPLVDRQEAAQRTGFEELANTVAMLGYLALFNGVAMAVLGFMTEFGITSEAIAKWHEIGVTAHQADMFGLAVLGVALAIVVVGRIMQKSARRA